MASRREREELEETSPNVTPLSRATCLAALHGFSLLRDKLQFAQIIAQCNSASTRKICNLKNKQTFQCSSLCVEATHLFGTSVRTPKL